MEYADVNPLYMLEIESLSLMEYAKPTAGAREKQRSPYFYHTGYNAKHLMPADTDPCLTIPTTDCDTTPGCSTYHVTLLSSKCVTSSRIQEIQNNGEVWKNIQGDTTVLNSSYLVVGSGSMDSEDINLIFSPTKDPRSMFLYYKLFLSKKTNVLHCVFSSAVVFDNDDLITLLTPVIHKLIETLTVTFEETSAEHLCVSGHSMGAMQTLLLAYIWESRYTDVFSKTTFIAFGPYKVLPVEWEHPQIRVYFTLSNNSIDPFSTRGNPERVQYTSCWGLDESGIKKIENRNTGSEYALFIEDEPLHAGSTVLHRLDCYIDVGKKLFKRRQGGTRRRTRLRMRKRTQQNASNKIRFTSL